MEFVANPRKKIEIEANGKVYQRHAIQTRFITKDDNYIDIVRQYAEGIYEEGDILSISEKIISICQNRIVKREELKVGFWAKFLSKFASHPSTGIGVGESIKMQYAIHKVGLWKVLWASIASGITKLFGKRGVFYEIVGQEVSGLDGFYGHVWEEYTDIGIELPENPEGVCNEIEQKLGISCMIVDSNDLGQEILGKSDGIFMTKEELKELIKDNPAGQGKERTPMILIREKH